jgi:hypothetical protein
MKILLILGATAAALFSAWVLRERRVHDAREAARRAYEEDAYENGPTAAKSRCAHAFTTFTQSGVPGVVTVTKKWCAVCRSDLCPAKLVETLFGNYWR